MVKLKRGYKYFGVLTHYGIVAVQGKYCEIPEPGYRFFVRKHKHLWAIYDLETGMRLWLPEMLEEARSRHKDAEALNDENGLKDGIELYGYHDGRKLHLDPDNWPEELRPRAIESEEWYENS